MSEAVVAHSAENPGQSVEQIGTALGAKTKDCSLPILRMIEAKKLETKRQRRGLRSHAAGATASAGHARKA